MWFCMSSVCIVVKYRWKGENVATTEVADHLLMVDCIEEANVYGVKVAGNNSLLTLYRSHTEPLGN